MSDHPNGPDGGGTAENGHQQAWELIPWYVVGTLDDDEAERVETHLGGCPICREEVRVSRRLAAAVRDLERSPATAAAVSDRRVAALMTRIDAAADPDAGVTRGGPAATASAAGGRRVWRRLAAALGTAAPPVRWALAAQLAAILVLAGALLGRPPAPAAPVGPGDAVGPADAGPAQIAGAPGGAVFHTLSDPTPETAAPAPGRLRLRVVFAPDTPERELRGALRELGATVVGGPSPTGVYTVEVAVERSVAERFRARPEIELAEPVAGAGVGDATPEGDGG